MWTERSVDKIGTGGGKEGANWYNHGRLLRAEDLKVEISG